MEDKNKKGVVTSRELTKRIRSWERGKKDQLALKLNSNISWYDLLLYIKNEIQESRRKTRFNYKIKCFLADGAYHLTKAIEEVFGTLTAKGEVDRSSGEEGAVSTIDIQLADGSRMKVPFGTITMDALGEDSKITIDYDYSEHLLLVSGTCEARFQSLMDDIVKTAENGIINNSIYRGMALEISDLNFPNIMNLESYADKFIVLSDDVKYELQNIEARILRPEDCVKKGVPLKFGALLEGPYGTGKTLLAFKLAYQAVQNNWVFIYLKDPTQLAETLRLAHTIDRSGPGCVIFTEDIDQVTRGDRDAAMQDIINTLDGGETKYMNVICLFTTNHVGLINRTFMRGKRVGTLITLDTLNAKMAKEFIIESFKDDYTIADDLTEICQYIENKKVVPAFMAEIVEKVKTIMLLNNQTEVHAIDLKNALDSYTRQMDLAKLEEDNKSAADVWYNACKDFLGKTPVSENLVTLMKGMNDRLNMDMEVK